MSIFASDVYNNLPLKQKQIVCALLSKHCITASWDSWPQPLVASPDMFILGDSNLYSVACYKGLVFLLHSYEGVPGSPIVNLQVQFPYQVLNSSFSEGDNETLIASIVKAMDLPYRESFCVGFMRDGSLMITVHNACQVVMAVGAALPVFDLNSNTLSSNFNAGTPLSDSCDADWTRLQKFLDFSKTLPWRKYDVPRYESGVVFGAVTYPNTTRCSELTCCRGLVARYSVANRSFYILDRPFPNKELATMIQTLATAVWGFDFLKKDIYIKRLSDNTAVRVGLREFVEPGSATRKAIFKGYSQCTLGLNNISAGEWYEFCTKMMAYQTHGQLTFDFGS